MIVTVDFVAYVEGRTVNTGGHRFRQGIVVDRVGQ